MAPITLPLSFQNSFWTQDYRTGLSVLFSQLEQGVAENDEIVAFLKARVKAEATLGSVLTQPAPTGSDRVGFGSDDGASLYMAFRGLQHESVAQGEAHRALAKDLREQVAEPFEAWAYQHSQRIQSNKEDMLDNWLDGYETEMLDIEKVRGEYLEKCRKADEAQDDIKFAPNQDLQEADKYTEATGHLTPNGTAKRTASVADRISERLKGLGQRSREPSPARHPRMAEPKNTLQMFADPGEDGASDGTVTPKLDKGKAKEVETSSPNAMSPVQRSLSLEIPTGAPPTVRVTTHLVLGGISFPASQVSALLFQAQHEMAVRNVKVPLLGEYDHCFSGEEFVVWLKMSIESFKGSLDLAEDAARTLTEEYSALRKIGELGNKFDNSPNAFYQFRAKAFNLQAALQRTTQDDVVAVSPVGSNFSENVASGIKRSNTVFSSIVKAVQTATTAAPSDELPHVKARKEAEAADGTYRKAARSLDQHRCALEERIEEILKTLQRWEMDRLNAIKTVLLQYQGLTAGGTAPLTASNERSSILISSFIPENDVRALIERYRTGPFRPDPKIYESITHHSDTLFGIDLRKWAGEGAFTPIRSVGSIDEMHAEVSRDLPPVISSLLEALRTKYGALPSDDQRRKSWIYEVPLVPVHHLRATLNTLPIDMPVSQEIYAKVDTPILASAVKLWLLELNPPAGSWEGWDEIKKIYPSVGAETVGDSDKAKELVEQLKGVLVKLPMINLKVLNAVVAHLKTLIDTTTTEESNDVFIAKLSMSMGRSILRPRQETSLSVQSNHASVFLADLIKHYDDILPVAIEQKQKDSAQRAAPVRKRTKLVDARQMRKSIDASADPKKYLEAQFALKNPGPSRPTTPNPPAGPGGERPPAFISPPHSPTASNNSLLPPLDTGTAPALAVSVASPPNPSPVNLNDEVAPKPAQSAPDAAPTKVSPVEQPPQPQFAEGSAQDEPFSPPSASSPMMSPGGADAILATGPASLSRTASSEVSRLRGPRVAGARGPRPLSTAAAATVPIATPPTRGSPPRQGSMGGGGSPRSSFSGRLGSPGPEGRPSARPRTPPDAKEYMPSKRGGRAPAASFSRTRPMGDGSNGTS